MAIFVFTLLLYVAGSAHAQPQRADSLSHYLKGYQSSPAGNDSCNACLNDVVKAVNSLHQYGATLGFNWGADYPEVRGSGTPNHWQGLQRLRNHEDGTPYFIVVSSHRRRVITPSGIEETSSPAHFAVAQMMSRRNHSTRLGSNRLEFGKPTRLVLPAEKDRIVLAQKITDRYDHPGGFQAFGKYMLLPADRAITAEPNTSVLTLWDMQDPLSPRKIWAWQLPGRDATSVGIVRLQDGRFLLLRSHKDAKRLDFYLLSEAIETDPNAYLNTTPWDTWYYTELKSDLRNPDGTKDLAWADLGSVLGEAAYQNTNLFRECGTGQLFLVASHGRRPSGFGGADQIDAFRLDVPEERPDPNTPGEGVVITKVATRRLYPGGNAGARQGDLQAAAGAFASPDNQLYFYASEHGFCEDGNFVRMIEFAPQIPRAQAVMLNDAWVELYQEKNYGGRSIVLDYEDRHLRDYGDFAYVEAFDSLASSIIYVIPAGFKLRLYTDEQQGGSYLDLIGTGKPEFMADLAAVTLASGQPADDVLSSAQWQGVITALQDEQEMGPSIFDLSQNYPNPFNPETVINYRLFEETTVMLEIYDIRGRLITTLVQQRQLPGAYTVRWDGTDALGQKVASGTYLYRLTAGEIVQVKSLTVLR